MDLYSTNSKSCQEIIPAKHNALSPTLSRVCVEGYSLVMKTTQNYLHFLLDRHINVDQNAQRSINYMWP